MLQVSPLVTASALWYAYAPHYIPHAPCSLHDSTGSTFYYPDPEAVNLFNYRTPKPRVSHISKLRLPSNGFHFEIQ